MADGGDGFDGCIEGVQRMRGYRRWPDDVKARSNAIGSREVANGSWPIDFSLAGGLWMLRVGMVWQRINFRIGGEPAKEN